jgi:hypothetical protein
MLLGDVGDDPPHAVKTVAIVAPETIEQAPVQNWRREMGAGVSIVSLILVRCWCCPADRWGKIETTRERAGFSASAESGWVSLITESGCEAMIS